jgi:hypothetical protein
MSIQYEFYSQEPLFINKERWEHLLTLGLPLTNKTVLEPGCGPGIFTQKFIDLSCDVFSLEARDELVDFHKQILPNSKIIKFNVDHDNWDIVPSCNITFAYGILYHLINPENFIKNISNKTTDFCIIETALSLDTCNNETHNVTEDKISLPQSYTGIGCRPTRRFIWKLIEKYFNYVYMPLSQPNHPDFPKQFQIKTHHTHRFIIIGSKVPLNNEKLSSSFVDEYI